MLDVCRAVSLGRLAPRNPVAFPALPFLLFCLFASPSLAADPPPLGSPDFRPSPTTPFGFRGDSTGRFPAATPVTEWSPTKNIRWSTAVGRSYSSPIVTEKSVFLTSEPNLLLCLDRPTGKIAWKIELKPTDIAAAAIRAAVEKYDSPKDGSGFAAATPLTDGQAVYAVLANGLVAAVGLDGTRKWTIGIDAEPTTRYGRSASPLLVGGKLIVHLSNLYAFDPATGRQLWVNTEAKSAYGTPAHVRRAGVDLLITPNGDVVRAEDGKSLNNEIGHTAHSTPLALGDGLACFADNEVRALRFNDAFKEEEIWNATTEGEVFGSPLLHDRTLFLATGPGQLFAFDTTGKGEQKPLIDARPLFENANPASPAAYGSLTLAGAYLFLSSNHGETVVLEATREAKLVSRNRLPEGSGASPVFSGGDMFLRAGEKLMCIGK